MIESLQIVGWDGIESGLLDGLAARTILICPDERCRASLHAALGFLRIEEQSAYMYTSAWSRSGPIGPATLPSLVSGGGARLEARVDGRDICLRIGLARRRGLRAVLQVVLGRTGSRVLRGVLEGQTAPLFEIGVDERAGEVVGLQGLPNGPATMIRGLFCVELPRGAASGTRLLRLVKRVKQVIFICAEPDAIALFRDSSEQEQQAWKVLHVSLSRGVLKTTPGHLAS